MKNKKIILVIVVLVLLWCFGKYNENKSDTQQTTAVEQFEENPPISDTTINLGILKTDKNGNSIEKINEFTTLENLLKNTDIQLITINYILKSLPPYEDISMQLVYNEIQQNLKLIYTKNNVIEEYSNICRKCLVDFLSSYNGNLYSISNFCEDSKYDFNNREMKSHAVGEKPLQNELDGSVKIVKDYIKENAKNPESVKFIEWSKVTDAGENWAVRCKYEGKNSLGAVVTENMWFYIQNSQVVKVKSYN